MAYYRIERTKLNFQPGSVSFYYNIQYDLAMITVIIGHMSLPLLGGAWTPGHMSLTLFSYSYSKFLD